MECLPTSLSPFHARTHTHTHTLTLLLTAGFNPKTRLQIGEWSRSIGLDYAQDGPGAAYVACGLGYLDAMAPANSGGAHAVGSAMLYSVQKVWDGTANDQTSSPDLNAGKLTLQVNPAEKRLWVCRAALISFSGRRTTKT